MPLIEEKECQSNPKTPKPQNPKTPINSIKIENKILMYFLNYERMLSLCCIPSLTRFMFSKILFMTLFLCFKAEFFRLNLKWVDYPSYINDLRS